MRVEAIAQHFAHPSSLKFHWLRDAISPWPFIRQKKRVGRLLPYSITPWLGPEQAIHTKGVENRHYRIRTKKSASKVRFICQAARAGCWPTSSRISRQRDPERANQAGEAERESPKGSIWKSDRLFQTLISTPTSPS